MTPAFAQREARAVLSTPRQVVHITNAEWWHQLAKLRWRVAVQAASLKSASVRQKSIDRYFAADTERVEWRALIHRPSELAAAKRLLRAELRAAKRAA